MKVIGSLIVCGVFLALSASAAAQTTIYAPGTRYPYQRWVDEAKVPTPDATIQLQESTEPCYVPALGCAGNLEIDLAPDLGRDFRKPTFLHELGHEFALTHPALASFTNERFADSYAHCALGGLRAKWSYSVGSGLFSGKRIEKVCSLIRLAALAA